MEVAAFSCLTNWAAGISSTPLSHQEVVEVGRISAGTLLELLAKTELA
jgi:purine-nucleoside phosphorylase